MGVCVPISPPLCPPPPPQMNRPIQVKPADSESRGGTSTHPLPPPWPRPRVPKPPPIPPTRVTPHPAPGRVSPPQGSVPTVEGPHFCPHPLPTTLSLWTRVGVPSPVPILGVPAHHSVPMSPPPCPHHHVPILGGGVCQPITVFRSLCPSLVPITMSPPLGFPAHDSVPMSQPITGSPCPPRCVPPHHHVPMSRSWVFPTHHHVPTSPLLMFPTPHAVPGRGVPVPPPPRGVPVPPPCPRRGPQALRGDAEQAAGGRGRPQDVRALRHHRRVHGAARPRRHQQRWVLGGCPPFPPPPALPVPTLTRCPQAAPSSSSRATRRPRPPSPPSTGAARCR